MTAARGKTAVFNSGQHSPVKVDAPMYRTEL